MKHVEGVGLPMLRKTGVQGFGMVWDGYGWSRKDQNEPWKGVWVCRGSQEWGGKGLEAVQCAPQLLVVEVCWEEEFTT